MFDKSYYRKEIKTRAKRLVAVVAPVKRDGDKHHFYFILFPQFVNNAIDKVHKESKDDPYSNAR